MKKLLIMASIVLLFIPNLITIFGGSFSIDDPPMVEILFPENETVVYDREIDVSIKVTDDEGITDFIFDVDHFYVNPGSNHFSWGDPKKIFYYNTTITLYKGYNSVLAYAYDRNENEGYNISTIFYNVTKDHYPPIIDGVYPEKGKLVITGNEILNLPVDFSILIGDFMISATCTDNEGNTKDMKLYIDNTLITDAYYVVYLELWGVLGWRSNNLSFGMHEIKVEVSDSFDNVATEQLDYFVIIF